MTGNSNYTDFPFPCSAPYEYLLLTSRAPWGLEQQVGDWSWPSLDQPSGQVGSENVRATQHRGATAELGTDQGVQALSGHPFSLRSQTLSLLPLLTPS